MKEFRIYFTIICIAYLATLSSDTFASQYKRLITRTQNQIDLQNIPYSSPENTYRRVLARGDAEILEKIRKKSWK
jgi:hypothetical protein